MPACVCVITTCCGCRTCYEQQVNLTSGKGCSSNSNSPVFGTLLSCCNWLQTGGIIDPILKPPTGLCARQGTEDDFMTVGHVITSSRDQLAAFIARSVV